MRALAAAPGPAASARVASTSRAPGSGVGAPGHGQETDVGTSGVRTPGAAPPAGARISTRQDGTVRLTPRGGAAS